MANFKVDGGNDMSTLDLSTIADGTITTNTSSEVVIDATDGTTYALYGDFSGGSGSTMPTEGTITRWVALGTDDSRVAITGMDLPVQTFETDVQNNDPTDLLDTIFAGNDTFDLTHGNGDNTVVAGAGNDRFYMGGTLDAQDSINGGSGFNTVILHGDYSSGLTLNDTTLKNIDKLYLQGVNTYEITTADGTVAAGQTLEVDARTVNPGGMVNFNGSAETDGNFDFFLGAAPGWIVTGGAGNDIFHGAGSGATLSGGGGNDVFIFGPNFDGTDTIDGGAGSDTVELKGDYSSGLVFGPNSLQNVEHVVVARGDSYDLTMSASNDPSGHWLSVDASSLAPSNSLTFDGSSVEGRLLLSGGAGDDTLTGGLGKDSFDGGLGADTMVAGASADRFVYGKVTESTGVGHDNIVGFNAAHDSFMLNVAVAAIDPAVTSGSLSSASFNADLHHDLGSAQLGAHDAVLFTASGGDMAGDTFLVVDENGVAGYQTNQDLVIQLTGAQHLADLSTANFTT